MSKQSARHAVLESEERSLENIVCERCGYEYPRLIGGECPSCGHKNIDIFENPVSTYNRIDARVIVRTKYRGTLFDFNLYNVPGAAELSRTVRQIMYENMTNAEIDNAEVEIVRLNPPFAQRPGRKR